MKKQLLRSKKSKMIGGVAGGIAEYFDIDPVIVRAIFIISTFGWGLSLIAYIVLWIIIPESYDEPEYVYNPDTNTYDFKSPIIEEVAEDKKNNRKVLAGAILIIIGALFLIDRFVSFFSISDVWPVVLIIVGGYLLYRNFQSKKSGDANEIG